MQHVAYLGRRSMAEAATRNVITEKQQEQKPKTLETGNNRVVLELMRTISNFLMVELRGK